MIAYEGNVLLGAAGTVVKLIQIALGQAGYRIAEDGEFGDGTAYTVTRFQQQHGLKPDGTVGPLTAHVLDAPHHVLLQTSAPQIHAVSGFPHDDTASLLAFYGRPWEDSSLFAEVPVPFTMTFREDNGTLLPIRQIKFHKKAAAQLERVLANIADLAKSYPDVLKHMQHFSGSYNYRPIRGSSRLSCHAFGAAADFHAEVLPLGHGVPSSTMPQAVVDAFKAEGFFWGGDYHGRKDPMHFQSAHE